MQKDLEQLAVLIRTAKNMTVFTGAGVSTLSGIRDFRGINGVYKKSPGFFSEVGGIFLGHRSI
jgi:NAD-dependent deacetylase